MEECHNPTDGHGRPSPHRAPNTSEPSTSLDLSKVRKEADDWWGEVKTKNLIGGRMVQDLAPNWYNCCINSWRRNPLGSRTLYSEWEKEINSLVIRLQLAWSVMSSPMWFLTGFRRFPTDQTPLLARGKSQLWRWIHGGVILLDGGLRPVLAGNTFM